MHREVKMRAATSGVSMQDLIEEIWRSRNAAEGTQSGTAVPYPRKIELADTAISEIPYASPGPVLANLTDLEEIAIGRLLRILRSPLPGLPDAILSNLVQFEAFEDLYERSKGAPNSASRSDADQPGGTASAGERIAALEQSAIRSGEAISSAARELAEIEEAARAKRDGEKRDIAPARKRSGNR